MAYLHPHHQEKISRSLRSGGSVVAIAGARRSGLTYFVDALVSSLASGEVGRAARVAIDLREFSLPDAILNAVADTLRLDDPPTNSEELAQVFQDTSVQKVGLWYFQNVHRATPESQDLLLGACLSSRLPHRTSALSNFILEGAVDFEDAVAKNSDSVQPLVAHVAAATPWRTIVEVEQMISILSSAHYPRSLIVWLADLTRGDTGFCNEFLLRLSDPAPSAAILNSTYDAIVKQGATARELREAAQQFDPDFVEQLLSGSVLPGLAPPDGTPEMLELVLAGLAEYDQLAGGYCLRSPMVGDALRVDGEWNSHAATPQPGIARCSHILWQVAGVEVLLRTLVRRDTRHEEAFSGVTVPAPWKGKAADVKRSVAQLLSDQEIEASQCGQILSDLSTSLTECLPDELPATETARAALERTGVWDGVSLLGGLTFSDLANLARRLDLVTVEEREKLIMINARRNDAAHFRPVQYDDAYKLEQAVLSLLPQINGRGPNDAGKEE